MLNDKNYELALELSQDILSEDPNNIHGLVFCGYAYDGLQDYTKSEEAYLKATTVDPNNVTPWKGLLVISERKKDGPLHLKSTIGLIKCFEKTEDFMKAVDAFNKTKMFARKHPWGSGETSKYEILELQLPGSPIFSFLESKLPNPADTYEQLVVLCEKEEKEAIKKSNSKNFLKIGKSKGPKKLEILYDVYKVSKVCLCCNVLYLFVSLY